MTSFIKVQRNGLVTIPKEWRSVGFKEGQFIEAVLREDGILLHPTQVRSVRPPIKAGGWRVCKGGVPQSVTDDLRKRLDKEFSKIDREEWK